MDSECLMEAMTKRMMEFLREGKRRNEAQQVVERVVERMSYFNGADVHNFLEVYNGEMNSRGVDEAEARVLLSGGGSTYPQSCKKAS